VDKKILGSIHSPNADHLISLYHSHSYFKIDMILRICLIINYYFRKHWREWGTEEGVQTMYTHVSKCKNDII
jgi:hypothetical protein